VERRGQGRGGEEWKQRKKDLNFTDEETEEQDRVFMQPGNEGGRI
jgi:hypothetical protein